MHTRIFGVFFIALSISILSSLNFSLAEEVRTVVIPVLKSPQKGSWINTGITFTSPYSYGGSYPSSIEYKKIGGKVYFRGQVNAGVTHVQSGQTIGTLPIGYRPPGHNSRNSICPTWGWPSGIPNGYMGTAGVKIDPAGNIKIQTAHQHNEVLQFLFPDNVSFSIE